eukprot:CAMPEP_0176380780 /NCGR_PEP_ID=MMETSP0126-20121128/31377_1 /TAXON_ID=141414 ORGANISM="Strombidinopsis acuminatum, Strain SPMC142" /NCGR_SAMPLE_ID=MMETSP0126 /ASSEMBLY_ACC=CAM_ASM_000229 /LENGTH=56 /DNA_ID=CAMNT_0017744253 /DNA_START=295 /DNA_END=465 /DNA_ORIENTATION=-
MNIPEGEGCYVSINRTYDGSYGTVSFNYETDFIYVFDDINQDYLTGDELGMIPVDT